ncbi:hypothetical protein MTR67_023782 [Solanum verrucosum]|uniref:Reverse transcriptase domain-containing protein n=1 Tax=Solanum verrucosum TaxID=315347 RepID=A0AAF0TRR1_SOLVR|nr:hypothetical protein MTR67_023782 [Solanum verrucosum]
MADIEEQEILESIRACTGDKSPGPDGLSMAFFKQCWEVIKKDLVAAIRNFHEEGLFERSLNATFVALIPKKVGAVELNYYTPTSLIGGVDKIMAKLLTERSKKTKKQASMVISKLDYQKAYDHLNWGFLIHMLENMGFGARWVKWSKHCISAMRFSILVNRTPNGFFFSQGGKRTMILFPPFYASWQWKFLVSTSTGLRVPFTPLMRCWDWTVLKQSLVALGANSNPIGIWNGVIEKFFASVIKRFDRIRRNFLGKVVETRKILSEMGGADSGKEVWRAIRNLWPVTKAKVNFKVGDGPKDSFWNDNWIGQAPLKQQYLDLFNLCLQQQATIAKMWTGQGWNLNFRRHLSDWELGRVAALKSTMAAFNNLKEERIPCYGRKKVALVQVFLHLVSRARRNEPTIKGTIIFDANSTISISPVNFQ